ncbi:hypothetical protein [Streptomyces sp. NPDC054838]
MPARLRDRVIVAAEVIHGVLAACPWIVTVLTADDLCSKTALRIVDGLVECGLTLNQTAYV